MTRIRLTDEDRAMLRKLRDNRHPSGHPIMSRAELIEAYYGSVNVQPIYRGRYNARITKLTRFGLITWSMAGVPRLADAATVILEAKP